MKKVLNSSRNSHVSDDRKALSLCKEDLHLERRIAISVLAFSFALAKSRI